MRLGDRVEVSFKENKGVKMRSASSSLDSQKSMNLTFVLLLKDDFVGRLVRIIRLFEWGDRIIADHSNNHLPGHFLIPTSKAKLTRK